METVHDVISPEANPYNAKKDWMTYEDHPRGLVGANDSLAYKVEKKTVVSALRKDPEVEQEIPDPTETIYKQVDYKKRYDDLKKHYDAKLQEFKTKELDYEKKLLDNVPKFKPPKSPEELEAFKKTNPDLFAVVQSVAHEISKGQVERLEKQVSSLSLRELQLAREAAESAISRKHPDFVEIRESDDFHEWAKTQPTEIQNWLYKNTSDPHLVIKAIDLYKIERGDRVQEPPVAETTRPTTPDASFAVMAKDAAPGPQSTSQKIWTTSEIEAMSIGTYEKFREEIDKAFLEGRIVQT